MKLHHLMEEMEQVIDDKSERDQVLEGILGFILSSTQVFHLCSCHACNSVTLLAFAF